ncbi:MAG TPA: OsmC family protein [Solirubrobacterales bacterium]|nr:OsmC family protein [Solirubrobacterales bacterium]
MRVLARRREGFAHEVEIEGGHTIVIDEPTEKGGSDLGPAPTRLVAGALAGCIAVTMEMYAERKGWDLGAVEVEVDVSYEDHLPRAFDVALRLPEGLSEEQKRRLTVVARKCPVHKLLAGETAVTVSDRVEPI